MVDLLLWLAVAVVGESRASNRFRFLIDALLKLLELSAVCQINPYTKQQGIGSLLESDQLSSVRAA